MIVLHAVLIDQVLMTSNAHALFASLMLTCV